MSRCSRYGAATRMPASATGSSSASPRNRRQSRPPRNRMPNAIATMTTNAPKSGSSSSESAGHDHHGEQRQEAADQRLLQRLFGVQERGAAHGVARRVQHDGDLHEFRGLHIDDGERQPPARTVDRFADARHEHQHQQRGAGDEQPRRQLVPRAHRHLKRDRRGRQADRDEHRVPREEIPGAITGVVRRFGHRDRRRIHHHQTDRRAAAARSTTAMRRRAPSCGRRANCCEWREQPLACGQGFGLARYRVRRKPDPQGLSPRR